MAEAEKMRYTVFAPIEGRFPLTEAEWTQFIAVLSAMKPALVGQREESSSSEEESSED